jgi:subtilisin family serine protease
VGFFRALSLPRPALLTFKGTFMLRRISLFGVIAILAACTPDQPSPVGLRVSSPAFAISAGDASDPSAGNYLVRFRGNSIPKDFESSVIALGGEVIFAHAGVGIAAVSGLDQARADELGALSSIAAVDPDAYTTFDEAAPTISSVSEEGVASGDDPTLASGFVNQWNMRAINAPAAWAAGKRGVSTVRVGILDTGIDYLEPDLVNRVDLSASRSFLSATENARVTTLWGTGTNLIADLHYHGTHVAATVASNAYYRAGVTSKVTLVGLKVCAPGSSPNFSGSCPTSAVLNAMLYAADQGLDVINMSLGGTFNRRDASARGGLQGSFIATISRVFNYVHNKGTTVVVSAGNGDPITGIGYDMDHDGNAFNAYCNAPHAICVSATGPTGGTGAAPVNVDAVAGYSNYGRSAITVAAPGGNFLAVSAACSGFTIVTQLLICRTRFFHSPAPADRAQFSVGLAGTSMAAPHVTGLAALIAGEVGHDPSKIAARLSGSADQLGFGGNSPGYGAGRINVAHAMGVN